MQSTEPDVDLATHDLGPLAWVLDELRKSLDSAASALRRFVRDANMARGNDIGSLDAGQLRIARQQLHQAVGALEMVGLAAPATVLRSMESAVQKFVQTPDLCSEANAAKVERAGLALAEYLEGVLLGKPLSAVALFPQYKDTQELAGADRIHPADLWSLEWRWVEPIGPSDGESLSYDTAVRSRMDHSVLKVVKTGDRKASHDLTRLFGALANGQTSSQARIFWRICAGFFDAMAAGLLPLDVYVKRAGSRVLLQYATLAKGDTGVSDRLAQDLVFFCSQAVPAQAADAPALAAVRLAWGLGRFQPVDYLVSQYGHFDPVLLNQARKRIAAAKESWSALSGGDPSKLRFVADQFNLVADSLIKLHPPSAPLSQALIHTIESLLKAGQPPAPELAMEVATAVLYLEAAFQELDPSTDELATRTRRLAERMEAVRQGAPAQALEPWMEELYRRVSDRQTMGSVVGELRGTLGELEKLLDQFFRHPQDKTVLRDAPSLMAQMRGVLSVLGLDQASRAVQRMRESVEDIINTDVDEALAREAGTFDKLGTNLGALGFLIDMLNYQPTLAKKLFVYDDVTGELSPLMGRTGSGAPAEPAAPPATDVLAQEVRSLVSEAGDTAAAQQLTVRLEQVAAQAVLADQPGVAQTARDAAAAVSANDAGAVAAAFTTLAAHVEPQTATPTVSPQDDIEEDDLRDIFLEEAREVVGNGLAAVSALAAAPTDSGELTTLRRSFHTLKGSSRMVGLSEFGEAAWALEQVLNTWLADQKQATEALRTLAGQALTGFGRWVEDIAADTDGAWKAAMFRGPADALRLTDTLLPLALPAATPAAAAAPAAEPTGFSAEATQRLEVPVEATPEPASVSFDFDLELAAAPEASAEPAPAPAAVEAVVPAPPPAMEALDFEILSRLTLAVDGVPGEAAVPEPAAPDAAVPETAAAPAAEPVLDLSFLDDQPAAGPAPEASPAAAELSFDLEFPAADVPAVPASPAAEEPVPAPEPAVAEAFSFGDLEIGIENVEAAPVAAAPAEPEAEVVQDAAPDVALEAPLLPDEPAEESVKVIGDLRIGIPLYNVYLNEADEWSRQLSNEVGEWAMELNRPVPTSAVGLAHALAGSSATVGFLALSEIARALEHAMDWTRTLSYVRPEHAQAFSEAAEEIRRLLHQFAAGFLKPADPAVLTHLHDLAELDRPRPTRRPDLTLVQGSAPDEAPADLALSLPQATDLPAGGGAIAADSGAMQTQDDLAGIASVDAASLDAVPAAPVEVIAELPVGAADVTAEPAPAVEPAPAIAAESQAPAAPEAPAPRVLSRLPTDFDDGQDDIDIQDAVDADLFPIFEEEATELLPQLGAALRQWVQTPGERESRDRCLRVLHTLKGSARLAGALRMGEMAHRMESEIEGLFIETVSAGEIEPLLHRFDAVQAVFDRLRELDAAQVAGALDALAVPAAASLETLDFASLPDAAVEAAPAADADADAGVMSAGVADAGLGVDTAAVAPDAAAPAAVPAATLPGAPRAPLVVRPAAQLQVSRASANQAVRVRSQLLDRLVNQAGEVMITRSRLEGQLAILRSSLADLTGNLDKLRAQLRDIELQAESQMQSRLAQAKDAGSNFDPLEFDRFTRVQELTRMMAESVNDVATVQRNLQRAVEATEDDLIAQARQTRDLQRDLLRTRMVEFDGIADRLYRVVRQSSKETGKQVRLDITGGTIEMDRGVLDRMTPAFEHLLRNCVAHGIERPEQRAQAGKDANGVIHISLGQEGNDVSVEFADDGAGLDLGRIRDKALQQGLIAVGQAVSEAEAANLIYLPGFSTAAEVTGLAGRGIGMDVVRSEVNALGGRIETTSQTGKGTRFKLVLPLTTAVTQVVMMRSGNLSIGVPANLVEIVRRVTPDEAGRAYASGRFDFGGETIPFYWSGALLQTSARSSEPAARTLPVVIFRSAAQRVAVHVDEVLGNQEVVVKNLGPQLSRLPGLAGMTVLASGAVVLIYNPVALSTVYGEQARALSAHAAAEQAAPELPVAVPVAPVQTVPLVLVVDDSITVRRVTQRLLQREGYRVALANDGLHALERLAEELPAVVLSDIEMPRMDGFDLARNIRGDARTAGLPIIMITSRIAEKHREHAQQLGVNHYLGKPYSEEELLSLLRRYTAVATA